MQLIKSDSKPPVLLAQHISTASCATKREKLPWSAFQKATQHANTVIKHKNSRLEATCLRKLSFNYLRCTTNLNIRQAQSLFFFHYLRSLIREFIGIRRKITEKKMFVTGAKTKMSVYTSKAKLSLTVSNILNSMSLQVQKGLLMKHGSGLFR